MGSSFFGKSFQSRYQATGRRGDLIFLDGYGQTIGDIDESARHCDFNVRDCSTSWLSVIHARPFSPVAVPPIDTARANTAEERPCLFRNDLSHAFSRRRRRVTLALRLPRRRV